MKTVIKLTEILVENKAIENRTVLIGVENIIKISRRNVDWVGIGKFDCTKIESRGAMVTTTYVNESVEEIYKLINSWKGEENGNTKTSKSPPEF